MALTTETVQYLVDGMANASAGLELAACIRNASSLSNPSLLILRICLGSVQEATNFQNAILGTYGLNPTDTQFIRDGFCFSDAALQNVLSNIKVVAPTFSVPAGSYGPAQSVSLASLTVGARIYYTTNGSTPTASSTLYSSPITVSSSETIKAIAITSGLNNSNVSSAAYVIDGAVATPTFSPVAGSYGPTQNVTVSSLTSGATFYYTTDGSTPTRSSTLYGGPISVSVSETIKVLGVKTNYIDSAIASAAYVINGAVATPTFSPIAGSYVGTQSVTVSSTTSGATFYYTTDGSTPTTGSTLYSGPISVAVSETVKVLGVKAGFSNSAIASAAYVIS